MNKFKTTRRAKLIGAGVIAMGLSVPFAAQAATDDEALAFVVGAAVGYALIDGHDHHHRHQPAHYVRGYPVRPAYGYRHPYVDHRYWKAHKKALRKWDRHERRWHAERGHGRGEARWDRHDRRHDWDDHRDGRRDRDGRRHH
ncbi:MAG: hypothetical protein R3E86_10135 [Pseudomonadales bacterium]